jgi:hypothetical protein
MKYFLMACFMVLFVSGCINSGGGQAPVQTTQVSGMLNDIASAISSGAGYKCTYTKSGVSNEISVKGQEYSTKSTSAVEVSNIVSDGVWVYVWVEGQDTGIKYNIQQFEGFTPSGSELESVVNDGDINQITQNAVNVQCLPTALSDSEFTAPASVQFKDLSEL